MQIRIFSDRERLARAAALQAAATLADVLQDGGGARLVAASAASQIEFLAELVRAPGVDWWRVELFQLDEYLGIGAGHPASFRHFLQTRLIAPAQIARFHELSGEGASDAVLSAASAAIALAPIDLAFVGIGENGHLAFNDPPADFEAEQPYLIVELDEDCRRQQVREGWFPSLADVPRRAISMSIRQILRAREIIAVVPGKHKAEAVRRCLAGAIGPWAPASALRQHPRATVYLDRDSASLLS